MCALVDIIKSEKTDIFNKYYCTIKGKVVPLQAWSGPECSRNLRFPDYMTTARDRGKVVSLMHRPPLSPEMLLVLVFVRG